jgi:hypothetical protein
MTQLTGSLVQCSIDLRHRVRQVLQSRVELSQGFSQGLSSPASAQCRLQQGQHPGSIQEGVDAARQYAAGVSSVQGAAMVQQHRSHCWSVMELEASVHDFANMAMPSHQFSGKDGTRHSTVQFKKP